MAQNRYHELLTGEVPPEEFVRRGLALAEADTRIMAMLALADWQATGITAPELFPAIIALQKPTWGAFNGLLIALAGARSAVLDRGVAGNRTRLQDAATLERMLGGFDKPLEGSAGGAVERLARFLQRPVAAPLTAGGSISLAIALASRIEFGMPADPQWWLAASVALRGLIELLAAGLLPAPAPDETAWPAPWFHVEDNQVWTYNGPAPDFSGVYVSDRGVVNQTSRQPAELVSAFGQLLGKTEARDRDFAKLLARLAPDEIRGVLLGDFLVGPPVGEGGFGTVHVGRQLSTGRKVAVKILHDGMSPQIKDRFQHEAAYLSRFTHPHIVGVYSFGEENWIAPRQVDLSVEPWFAVFSKSAAVKSYIAMEWIEGRTLDQVFRQAVKDPATKPPMRQLAEWFAQAAEALLAVHSASLIHRDIKPSNLMIADDGEIKLMDFGVARQQAPDRTLKSTDGQTFGTIVYMSPEQLRAVKQEAMVGSPTDIYSLCATFYELFTLTRLYQHDSKSAEVVETLKLAGQPPPRPRKQVKDLPWEIEVILLGGLETEVADRYRSADALERDLRHFLNDEPIEYRPVSMARRLRLGYRRHRAVINVVAVSLLAVILGVGFYIKSIRAEQARTLAQKELAQQNARESLAQKNLAQQNAQESVARLAASYEEQGRQELLAGQPLRAAVYLSRAYSMGRDAPAMRFLLGQATRAIPARVTQSQGHTRGVYTAEFTRDGSRIVTAGRDGLVKIWNARTGRVLHTLPLDPAYEVIGATFNPDGTRVVAMDKGGHGAVWDAATGRQLFRLEGLGQVNYRPCFSPDGTRILACGTGPDDGLNQRGDAIVWDATDGHRLIKLSHEAPMVFAFYNPTGTRIITGYADRGAGVWDAATGRQLHVLSNTARVTCADFSPDGSKVAVTSEGFTPIEIDDSETGRWLETLPGHQEVVRLCLFGPPDGKLLLTCNRDATVRLWDCETKVSVVLKHEGQVLFAAFSHDGRQVGSASRDGTVKLWDTASGGFTGELTGHTGYVYQLAFSPDGRTILTASEDKTARLWDARSHQLLLTLDGRAADDAPTGPLLGTRRAGNDLSAMSMSPDGTRILVTGVIPTVSIAATGQDVAGLAFLAGKIRSACFSADGKLVAAVDSSCDVGLVNLGSGQVLAAKLPGKLNSIAFSPDGQRLIAGGASNGWIVDVRSLRNVDWPMPAPANLLTLPHGGGEVVHAEFSPDGQLAVTAGSDGTARLWNAATGALQAALRHGASVAWATFSPDGRWVLTASWDGTAVLWDAATGQKIRTLKEHTDHVLTAIFCRDGRQIVTTSRDYTAKVWDTSTGQRLASLDGHAGVLTCANFSPDGNLVVTGSEDGKAMVWHAATGKLLLVLRGHLASVRGAEFTRDGTRIITASEDDTVRIWDAHLESRTAAQIADQVKHAVPWRLEGERLLPVSLAVDPVPQTEGPEK